MYERLLLAQLCRATDFGKIYVWKSCFLVSKFILTWMTFNVSSDGNTSSSSSSKSKTIIKYPLYVLTIIVECLKIDVCSQIPKKVFFFKCVSPLVCRGPWMSNVVLYCWCNSDSASVRLYFTFAIYKWYQPLWWI